MRTEDIFALGFVTEGKGKQTVQRFCEHLLDKGGYPDRVLEVVSDMSGGFVAAVAEHFPKAEKTYLHIRTRAYSLKNEDITI